MQSLRQGKLRQSVIQLGAKTGVEVVDGRGLADDVLLSRVKIDHETTPHPRVDADLEQAIAEYDRLATLANATDLPPLSAADAQGNYPAVEYARASLARKIIRDRGAAGLTQRELAKLAGISVENLCRIETGKHVLSVPTIDKIDRALKRHAAQAEKKQAGKAKAKGR